MTFRDDNRPLFRDGDLGALLHRRVEQVITKVDSIPEAQFLASTDEQLVEHIVACLEIQPLQLHEDMKVMDQSETKIDVSSDPMRNPFGEHGSIFVSGIRVKVTIPYTGNPDLWRLQLHQFQNSFPRANVSPPVSDGIGYIDIIISKPSDEGFDGIKRMLEDNLSSIRTLIGQQEAQLQQDKNQLPKLASDAVRGRKQRLRAHCDIAEALNIPLRRSPDAPAIDAIPIKRRLVRPLPTATEHGASPDPGISQDDYEHILSVIRHEGRTFEATPKTFSVHDEEELRDILMAHLNGHYQGLATGETFRRLGKTDIRIEDKDRAAFVAECKVWRGQKGLSDALEQLLGYLTWRDCKAAIIIFNKQNKQFSELLSRVPETLSQNKKLISEERITQDGEWRYMFSSLEDEGRHITVHVFLFNLFVDE